MRYQSTSLYITKTSGGTYTELFLRSPAPDCNSGVWSGYWNFCQYDSLKKLMKFGILTSSHDNKNNISNFKPKGYNLGWENFKMRYHLTHLSITKTSADNQIHSGGKAKGLRCAPLEKKIDIFERFTILCLKRFYETKIWVYEAFKNQINEYWFIGLRNNTIINPTLVQYIYAFNVLLDIHDQFGYSLEFTCTNLI